MLTRTLRLCGVLTVIVAIGCKVGQPANQPCNSGAGCTGAGSCSPDGSCGASATKARDAATTGPGSGATDAGPQAAAKAGVKAGAGANANANAGAGGKASANAGANAGAGGKANANAGANAAASGAAVAPGRRDCGSSAACATDAAGCAKVIESYACSCEADFQAAADASCCCFQEWSDATFTIDPPSVGNHVSGNAIAAWWTQSGSRGYGDVWVRRFTTDEGWGPDTAIDMDPTIDASAVSVAVNGGGAAIAVWSQRTNDSQSIWAKRYTSASGWGPAVQIWMDAENAPQVPHPQVAIDKSGNATAVWEALTGGRYNVWANHTTGDSVWSSATIIESDRTPGTGAAIASEPRPMVSFDDSGNAIAVWHQSDGTHDKVWSNRYTAGAWGTATTISANSDVNASLPTLAVDSTGDVVVVWNQDAAVWSNRYVLGTGWGTATMLGMGRDAMLASDGAGNYLAAWQSKEFTAINRWYIWSARYTSGSGWGATSIAVTIDIDSRVGFSGVLARAVALDRKGNALVFWQEGFGVRFPNAYARYVVGNGWSPRILLVSDPSVTGVPALTLDPSGRPVGVAVMPLQSM